MMTSWHRAMPLAFSNLTLRFMDGDTLVAQCDVPYGGSLVDEDVPVVARQRGAATAKWDTTDFSSITFDMTINAEYSQLNTTPREQRRARRPVPSCWWKAPLPPLRPWT